MDNDAIIAILATEAAYLAGKGQIGAGEAELSEALTAAITAIQAQREALAIVTDLAAWSKRYDKDKHHNSHSYDQCNRELWALEDRARAALAGAAPAPAVAKCGTSYSGYYGADCHHCGRPPGEHSREGLFCPAPAPAAPNCVYCSGSGKLWQPTDSDAMRLVPCPHCPPAPAPDKLAEVRKLAEGWLAEYAANETAMRDFWDNAEHKPIVARHDCAREIINILEADNAKP